MAKPKPEQVYTTQLPNAAITFDIEAFDEFIRSQGVTFVHYRGMRCPVGMIDEFDTRRPHEDHIGCSNGFLYTKAGEVTCLFLGNGNTTFASEAGLADSSTVSVTLPRFYDGCDERVYPAAFDRLYLAEESIAVVNWQTYRHSVSGTDKLAYPAVRVWELVDSNGNRYHEGDYEIRQGNIHWISPNRPGLDPETGKGLICSIRYSYRPFFYIKHLVHEVRVSQAENPITGERQVHRMPQAVQLQREYVFHAEQKDEQAANPNSPRQQLEPEGNSSRFGPRF